MKSPNSKMLLAAAFVLALSLLFPTAPEAGLREFFESLKKKPAPAEVAPPAEAPADEAPAPEPPPPPPPPEPDRAVIAAVGDIILHGRCHQSARQQKTETNNEGYDHLFGDISAELSDADLAIGNMEFPLFPKSKPPKPFIFSGPPSALRAIHRAGFHLVTAANNHAFDHGRQSPASTAKICRDENAVCLGVGENRKQAEAPYFVEIDGIRLAVIGYSLFANDNLNIKRESAPRVNGYDFPPLLSQVKEAAKDADCVVVNVHWGEEYRLQPTPSQKAWAREMAEAGACLIIGHHPHVPEPIETLEMSDGRRALVAYSLGNFVSNQERKNPSSPNRLGILLKAELTRTEKGVEVTKWDTVALWTLNRTAYLANRSYEDVRPMAAPARIAELEEQLLKSDPDLDRLAAEKEMEFLQGRIDHANRLLENPSGP